MEQRIDMARVARQPLEAFLSVEKYLEGCGLETRLLDLVKLRASQLNGCAYCIDMHSKDLRAGGESEQRIYELLAWQETPFYSDRERAALAWTEAVTQVGKSRVGDDVYELARSVFSEKELVDLTHAIAMINVWNRLAVAFRQEVGSYEPKGRREAEPGQPAPGAQEHGPHLTSTSDDQEILH